MLSGVTTLAVMAGARVFRCVGRRCRRGPLVSRRPGGNLSSAPSAVIPDGVTTWWPGPAMPGPLSVIDTIA